MNSRFLSKRALTLLSSALIVSLLLVSAGPFGYASVRSTSMQLAPGSSVSASVMQPTSPVSSDPNTTGLAITLSDGKERPQGAEQLPAAETQPLSPDETQALLDRLPALDPEAGDEVEFRLPAETLKPPRPGTTVNQSFPPTDTVQAQAPEVTPEKLEVLRFAPEGPIRIAPFLQVTFNQPMVPLATLDQLKDEEIPVKITPALPGVWKWIGTKTLVFEYKPADDSDPNVDRFPKATDYEVEIPAGTTSASGAKLDKAVTWNFSSPPPILQFSYPYNYQPQPRNPVLFASFDQKIDPAAVLEVTKVSAGGEQYQLVLLSADEATKNTALQSLIKQAGEGRWLAFKADKEFPADTTVNVSIGPNTPSAEGPLTNPDVQGFSFATYAPLRITDFGCGYGSEPCPPGTPIYVNFNNSLNQEKFDPSLVTISPEIPGLIVENFGASLQLRGAFAGRSTYKITVNGKIEDIFAQTLGKDQELEVKTGSAYPILQGPNGGIITADPSSAKPAFTFYTVNYDKLRVRMYAVTPDDWTEYLTYLGNYWNSDTPPTPPGKEVINRTVSIGGVEDQLTENSLDLSEALNDRTGHVLVIVDVPSGIINKVLGSVDRSVVQSWVQVTQIGLDAFVDHTNLVAWATDLKTGAPLDGVKLSLSKSKISANTDENGVANLELPDSPAPLLIGENDGDVAILPQATWDYYGSSGFVKQATSDELRWYIFDDRAMYRPNEEVHVKGWMRVIGSRQDGQVGLPGGITGARYQVTDPQGNTLIDAIADVNALGGFDLAFTLPEGVNLGTASINFTPVGGFEYATGYHSFQIQEFRRPEFEVTAQSEGTGPYIVGDEALVSVSAQYYAGGPLPNAETTWNVNSSTSSYSPPGWEEFIFGSWTPWWFDFSFNDFGYRDFGGGNASVPLSFVSKTDPAGKHYLRMQFISAKEPKPYSVSAESVVMDLNRQAWASSASLLVHPSALYVGLRSQRTFVEQGTPIELDVIVPDIDGKAQAGIQVKVTAARLEWKYVKGNWKQEEVDPQECAVESAVEAVQCSFDTTQGGEYRIVAQVRDERERLNQTELTRWVSGGKVPARRNIEQEQVTLIPDKQSYQPGETAEILVQAPWSPAEGLLSVTRNGILYTERFTIEDGTTTLKIPLKDEHIPNVNIQVDLNGSAPRTDEAGEPIKDVPARPAYATGSLMLSIPPLSRTLKVEAAPEASKVSPGAETSVTISVTDAAGNPVDGSEVALVVVDESVLALTGYQLTDPVAAFYSQQGSYLSSYYARSSILLANPETLAGMMTGGMGGGGEAVQSAARSMDGAMDMAAPAAAPMATEEMALEAEFKSANAPGQAAAPIAVRSDFNPLAIFAPAVTTDADGKATVTVKLPDNLTRYRVMAVAVAEGKYFGKGEANLTARLPLMVRPAAPRFLNFGDQFDLPIIVQNQTDEPLQVSVAVRASNLQSPISQSQPISESSEIEGLMEIGRLVEVPANDRVEVRFPAITVSAGTARFQVAVAAGEAADAATIELPVYTPATTEAFAVYGVVDEGAIAQPVARPENVFPQYGGLEVSTSSTAVQALTDAVLYLTQYPFECSEQISSRLMGIAGLRDVLSAFKAEGLPSPEELEKSMVRDVARLQQMQNFDGGWPIWQKGRESVPYYSIHVAHALQRAKMKAYEVPAEMLSAALEHLRNIENFYPAYYGEQTKHVLSSYAVYVRDLMGDTDTVKARSLLNKYALEETSLETIAWLWQVLSDDPSSTKEIEEIRRIVNNRAVETAGAANFTTSYGEDEYLLLHSNRRTDGIVLDALINDQPDSDLIPKVVTGLLANRTAGRWGNTQENAFILLALDRYFNTFEAQTPDFVARIWLGETYAGEHVYEGRTTERNETVIPMEYLVGADQSPISNLQSLVLSKEGEGRLYYRLGLRYAPSDLNMPALDMGFVVQRTYEAVDNAEDVKRDENGVWRIKAGARVRVRIKMVADNRRYHVALVDPLPAGLEIINPALAVSENIPSDPQNAPYGWWWGGSWYQHQNLRDQRAEAFTTLLWDGVYDYDYVARATTPGTFVVPPAKAEEMYSPEVFGRSAIDQVVVE